jgi:hypothetical protein
MAKCKILYRLELEEREARLLGALLSSLTKEEIEKRGTTEHGKLILQEIAAKLPHYD